MPNLILHHNDSLIKVDSILFLVKNRFQGIGIGWRIVSKNRFRFWESHISSLNFLFSKTYLDRVANRKIRNYKFLGDKNRPQGTSVGHLSNVLMSLQLAQTEIFASAYAILMHFQKRRSHGPNSRQNLITYPAPAKIRSASAVPTQIHEYNGDENSRISNFFLRWPAL